MLIVLDGIDGTGKTTQFELVQKHLTEKGVAFKAISFPDYNEKSSELVKMYLNGEVEANPYAASTFYAVDRYVSFKKFWEEDYKKGTLILASRYTTSNLIHQLPRVPKEQWRDFTKWIENFEYHKLALPRPDLVIYLTLPPKVSMKLIEKRGEAKDIHENQAFLEKCSAAGEYIAEKLKWTTVVCGEEERIYSIENINDVIMYHINSMVDKN
ncbi:MAG: deoxynucleoside kinase [Oscillospiraceae bacterium]|jgi:dTMP kinase|nr:deoxynucleoside kinase [Oscillospiraceae bacterium]